MVQLVFIACVVAIAVFAIYRNRGGVSYYDEIEYLRMASGVAGGEGLSLDGVPTAFKPPTWPLLLAVFVWLGAPSGLLPLISVAAAVGSALVARAIAGHLAGEVAGWIAAFGMLLYPLNVYTSATLYPQSLATVLLLLPLLLIREPGQPRTWQLAGAGVSIALMVLAVPTMAFAGLLVAVWLLWRFRSSWVRVVFVAGVAAVLPIAVWSARNYIELGEFVPLSTATGVNLLMGNNPNATAETGASTATVGAQVEVAEPMDEVTRNRYFTAEATGWVSTHPGDAAQLFAAKVLNYFAPYNAPQSSGEGSVAAMLVGWVTFVPLLVLAGTRLLMSRSCLRLRSPEMVMWALFLSNALFMAVTFTRTRFRQPLDSVLIIEAAVALVVVVAVWRRSRATADLATAR